MPAKTQKVRVAVSGKTIDGRTLTPDMLKTAAKSYDYKNRAARVNLNHISGFSAQEPFVAYGDVLSAEAREEEMVFNGQKEKVTALYAEVMPNDQLIALNKKGQALYTSIELWPDYRGQEGVWALGGLAVTDTPAAFGTDRLQFSTLPQKLDGVEFSTSLETSFIPEDENEASKEKSIESTVVAAFAAMTKFFTKEEPKPEAPKENSNEFDAAAFGLAFNEGLTKLAETIGAQISAVQAANTETQTKLAALEAKLEASPPQNYTPRPTSTGANSTGLAVC